jgi:hypothetical protein
MLDIYNSARATSLQITFFKLEALFIPTGSKRRSNVLGSGPSRLQYDKINVLISDFERDPAILNLECVDKVIINS